MIISPISSVTTPALQGTAQATAALNLDRFSALAQSSAISNNASLLDAIRNNSSNITVDVSRLGELLAYTAKLQIQQAANASGTDGVNRTDATQTKADVAQLTAIANSFVDAFNQLQASNSSLSDNPLIASASDSLLQAMNTGAQNADGSSLFWQLAEIGIKLQNTALPGSDSFLTLDVTSFQNALAKDPSATLALLTQALQVLGSAESTVIAQNQELASGNIQTNTNQTQNTNTTNSINASTNADTISGTTATSNLNANAVNPANIPSTNTEALLQQTLVDEALLAAIDTARNTQTVANTDVPSTVTANTAGNTAQAISTIPASSVTRVTELPVSNNAVSTSRVNTPENVTSNTVENIAANAGSNATLTTQALDQNTSANISAADAGDTTSAVSTTADIVASTLPQSLNAETPTLTTPQSPPTEIVDTSATAQAKTVTENKLPVNITTPSSLLTESQLENQIAANSIKSNENAVSTTMPSNAQTALNNASTLTEVSKTLATINQASAAASNLAAGNQTLPANPASTAVASAVTSNNSTVPTPVSNSATLNANAIANGIQDGINPLISVAVAAYRVRNGIQANTTEKPRTTQTDAVTATEAVTGVEPVKLDLHEHSQNQHRDAEADSAYHKAEELGEPKKNAEVTGNINVNVNV